MKEGERIENHQSLPFTGVQNENFQCHIICGDPDGVDGLSIYTSTPRFVFEWFFVVFVAILYPLLFSGFLRISINIFIFFVLFRFDRLFVVLNFIYYIFNTGNPSI